MKKLKRVLAIALSLVIASSNLVYAGFNGTGDGSDKNPSTLEDVGSMHLYHVNQGFRIYIVNDKGLAVTNSVDFVKYLPWQIKAGFGESAELMEKMWNDYYNVTGAYKRNKDIIEYLGGVKTDYVYAYATGNINKDGSNPSNKLGVTYLTREVQPDSLPTDLAGYYYSPGKMYTITALEKYLRTYIEADYGSWQITGTPNMITYQDKLGMNGGNPIPTYNKIMAPIEFLRSTESLVGTGEEMKNLMVMPLSTDPSDDMILVRYLVNLKMFDTNGIGEIVNGGQLVPLFKIIDSTVLAKYLEIYQKATTNEDRKQALITTMRDMNLKVAFEPVSWAVPAVLTNQMDPIIPNNLRYTWTSDRIVYGTPTNIVSYTMSNFAKDYQRIYPNNGMPDYRTEFPNFIQWLRRNKIQFSWQWGLTPKVYRTERAIPEFGMEAYNPDEVDSYSLADMGAYSHSLGYGVMYFGIDAIETTRTSTWDSITYPKDNYSPGMAPEPPITSEGEEYTKVNKDHKFKIVKFYGEKQPDGNIIYTENYTRDNTVHNISIDDEVEYKVEDWFTSSDFKQPSSKSDSYDNYKSSLPNGQTGDSSGSVIIKPDSTDTVLYVKLIKEKIDTSNTEGLTQKITLHENELSYPYSLGDLTSSLEELWWTFPDKSHNGSGSHSEDDGDGSTTYWSCSWHRVISDDRYKLNVTNAFDYNSTNFIGSQGIFAGTEGGKVNTSDSEKSASLSGFESEHLIPNWMFSLYRDKSKDKVTLYPNKNSQQVINDMSLIGVNSASYIPSDRIAKEGSGSYIGTFSVKYVYENLDKELSWRSTGCGSHGDSGTYSGTEAMYIDTFNAKYNEADNTLTKYYLGTANTGNVQPDASNAPFHFDSKSYKSFLSTKLQNNHTVKFYPMTKMDYTTHTTAKQDVYVTSTNESSLLAPTRVEVGVYKDNSKPGLLLSSTQWSTHAKTQEFLNRQQISDKNSMLPGGAIYDLKTSNSASGTASDNWVGLHTYQVCIPDANMERLSSRDGVISESVARQQLNSLLTQAENVLEHYQIVQWTAQGIHTTEAQFKSASPALVSGVGQVSSFGGNTLDRSGKYYLKVDGAGADRSDLDIVGKSQDTITWTLSSDVDGNVVVKNDKGVNVSITKNDGLSNLIANADVKMLDEKTKVVTNFLGALDRNQGNSRDSQKWYNEGFEEIKVIENYSGFKLGFGSGQEARSSALDTKLTGKLDDRRDLYNFDESSLSDKTRTSQFKTSARSTDPSASGKAPGYIGSIDGLDIVIPNMENLMVSKLFYIPNASVTDLN